MKLTISLILVMTSLGCSKAISATNLVQIAVMTNQSAGNGYWEVDTNFNVPDMPDPVGIYGTNHFNSWGVKSTNKLPVWKGPKQRERFNSIMAGKYHMDTNGIISTLTNSSPEQRK